MTRQLTLSFLKSYRWQQLTTTAILAAVAVFFLSPLVNFCFAQQAITWEEPRNLSTSQTTSLWPYLVADASGIVHLLWAEDIGGDIVQAGKLGSGNALMYRKWQDGVWSEPRDILISPGEEHVASPVAAVDSKGILHVVWTGNQGLYYSNADTRNAENPSSWRPPLWIAPQGPSDIYPIALAVDNDDAVHIIYATSDYGQEVMHTFTGDEGLTWSTPNSVSASMPSLSEERLVSSGLSLMIAEDGRFHAGWTMWDNKGFGQAVYYAQSRDGGLTWGTPLLVDTKNDDDYEASWLAIGVVGSDEVHLVWIGRDRVPGRSHRMSSDGGTTWSENQPIMEGYRGGNRALSIAIDAANRVHLFSSARTAGDDTSVRHVSWMDDSWGPVTAIDPSLGGQHSTTATVLGGNHLFVAWEEFLTGEIMVSEGWADAPSLPPTRYPERPAFPLVQGVTPEVSSTPVTLPVQPNRVVLDAEERGAIQNGYRTVTLGVLPAMVLVVIVFVLVYRRR